MILSGCDFNPESLLKNTGDFFTQTIPQEFQKFVDGMMGKKSEEPKKEEKEEQPEQQEGEQGGEEQQQKQLVSISVSGQFKSEYELGDEAFDPTGVVVTAVYDDGSSEDVSSQASFGALDSSKTGSTTVTVSFGGQSAQIECTIIKTHWTAAEKALFDQHLHGIELPFLEIQGASVVFDQQTGAINVLDEEGKNLSLSGNDLAKFAAKFTESDGWVDVSSDYSAGRNYPDAFFVFEKSAQTSDGMRRISVQFFGNDGENYTKTGSFYLFASDPFNYEFPAQEMAAEFAKYNMTPFTLPAPDAQDMYFEFYPDSNNDLYAEYLMDDYINATIYFYGFTEETFNAYLTKLGQAGWKFTSEDYSGTTVYSGTNKMAGLGMATIEQLYFTPTFSALNYDYLLAEIPEWPTEDVAKLVQKFAPGSETVIPECPDATSYKVYMSDSYNEIDCGGSEELKAAYAAVLKQNNWTETEEGSYIFISPAEDIQLILVFTSYGLEIRVSAYVKPSASWPTDQVAALFPPENTDVLPPFEGTAESFQTYNDSYGTGVIVTVGEGNEDAAITSYGETLLTAGFTAVEGQTNKYTSPHGDFVVEVAKGIDGAINLELSITPKWPTSQITAGLKAIDENITDSLPALEGADSYTVYSYATKVRIYVELASSSVAPSTVTQYQQMLVTAGFADAGADADGDKHFNSPNSQFEVCAYAYSYYMILDIVPGTFTPPAAGWQAEDVAAALKALDSSYTDVLPEFTSTEIFSFDDTDEAGLRISVYLGSSASAAVSTYEATLAQAGFHDIGQNTYGDNQFMSPNNQYKVVAWASNGYFIIDVNPNY